MFFFIMIIFIISVTIAVSAVCFLLLCEQCKRELSVVMLDDSRKIFQLTMHAYVHISFFFVWIQNSVPS